MCCDFCTFLYGWARPICTRHRYTRSPWNGELHTLCPEHEQQLHDIRKAWVQDHQSTPRAFEWRRTQAHEYEPYLAAATRDRDKPGNAG